VTQQTKESLTQLRGFRGTDLRELCTIYADIIFLHYEWWLSYKR